jgi:hypothetical protein
MEWPLVVWALLTVLPALVWLVFVVRLAQTHLRREGLRQVPDSALGGALPPLSVIVPARDEERDIEAALRSLLEQDYPGLEVVAVDDRSRDGTGAILEELATEFPSLVVVPVTELPEGWMGKNHACHLGAAAATGDWLLFTDADVRFEPGALRRAVALADRQGLGHLVVWPRLLAGGFWARSFQATFGLFMNLKLRPWALNVPRSRSYVGVGAFNMVARWAYDEVGGHRTLAMEVVDDVKLGLILRRSGVPQGAAAAGGLVSVPWARGVRSSLAGLLKNSFAAAEWSWPVVAAGVVVIGWLMLGPWAALAWAGSQPPWLQAAAAIGMVVPAGAVSVTALLYLGGTGLEGLVAPVSGLLLAAVLVASALVATVRGGIYWRGRFYPLSQLRERCVRESDWPREAAVGW